MKVKVKYTVKKEVDFKFVHISVPVRYGAEDIPYDFPLRKGDLWEAMVDIDTGEILDWPKGSAGEFCMKVCDEGTYVLHTVNPENGDIYPTEFKIEQDYVPNDLLPGSYGDYLEFKINENGVITNWPKYPSINEFLKNSDED